MKVSASGLALGWGIWRRHRTLLSAAFGWLILSALVNRFIGAGNNWTHVAESVAFTGLGGSLLLTMAAFHFTEGTRKAGFGSFPVRLFRLPVATRWLVGAPMAYGAASVLALYLGAALLVFRPLGTSIPILWPCVYLLFGLTQFQTIIWSLPENRYLKLLCLSVAASIILAGWMFFLPHIVEGTLEDWGYRGNPETFQRVLLGLLTVMLPVAYVTSLHSIRRQRHGAGLDVRWLARGWDQAAGKLLRRRGGFRSAAGAMFWQEWRQTGLVLPLCVGVIVLMICVPTLLAEPVGIRGTRGVLLGLLFAPLLLSLIIGRGFGKPDFWESSLSIPMHRAARPVSAGQWVVCKLQVAAVSVGATWLMVIFSALWWTIFRGDFLAFEGGWEVISFYYQPWERLLLAVPALPTLMLLSWRLLVGGLAAGMSGRAWWFRCEGLLVAAVLLSMLVFLITQDDTPDKDWHLHRYWPLLQVMPLLLGVGVLAKSILSFVVWTRVVDRKLCSDGFIAKYFAGWIVATAAVAVLAATIVGQGIWLRSTLMLLALLWVPLAGPGLAMLSLADNRSRL